MRSSRFILIALIGCLISLGAAAQKSLTIPKADSLYTAYQFETLTESIDNYKPPRRNRRRRRQPIDTINWQPMRQKAERAMRMLDKVQRVEVIDTVRLPLRDAFLYVNERLPLFHYMPQDSNLLNAYYLSELQDRALRMQAPSDSVVEELQELTILGGRQTNHQVSYPDLTDSFTSAIMPFLKADGITLLFAAEGSQGIGGYDLYMSRKNADGQFLAPALLGMPFNSPADDYLLAYDESMRIGYLVSNRFCDEGEAMVYLFMMDEVGVVTSNDPDDKRAFAMWHDIAVTQDPDKDYQAILTQIQPKVGKGDKMAHSGYRFALNSQTIYDHVDQFQSLNAQEYYRKWCQLRQWIDEHKAQLQQWRKQYHDGDHTVADEILNLEHQVPAKQQEAVRLTQQIRQHEQQIK